MWHCTFRAAIIHICVAVLITMSVIAVWLLKSIPGKVSMMVACSVLLKRMVPQDYVWFIKGFIRGVSGGWIADTIIVTTKLLLEVLLPLNVALDVDRYHCL